MTYYHDLSEYAYHGGYAYRPVTLNIGWLDFKQKFETSEPDEKLLDTILSYCAISVAQMRGMHLCEECRTHRSVRAERNGQQLLLGSSEIRVFSSGSIIYAAPTMIYHYISVHH